MSAADPDKIQRAIDVFAEPNRLTKGFYARNVRGHCIGFDHPTAVTFDIEGALLKGGARIGGPEWMAVREVVRKSGFDAPHEFDQAIGCTQDAVVTVLERAKALAIEARRPVLRIAS